MAPGSVVFLGGVNETTVLLPLMGGTWVIVTMCGTSSVGGMTSLVVAGKHVLEVPDLSLHLTTTE